MLPQGQSSDIASRLNDRSLRDDEPSFNNSTKKSRVVDSGINEIFGLSLFTTSPTTFAPIDFSPAPLNYVIGPGDELKIQYFKFLLFGLKFSLYNFFFKFSLLNSYLLHEFKKLTDKFL